MGMRWRARLLIGGLAGAGMYLGHLLAANLAAEGQASTAAGRFASAGAPDAGFHPPASLMALLLAVVVSLVVGSVIDRARRARPGPMLRRFVPTALMLGTIQMLACGGLCLLEHVWFGRGFTAFFELEVGVALAIQAVVALIAAMVLTLLAKLVRFISRILRPETRAPRALPLFGARPTSVPRVLLLAGGTGVRGPPLF